MRVELQPGKNVGRKANPTQAAPRVPSPPGGQNRLLAPQNQISIAGATCSESWCHANLQRSGGDLEPAGGGFIIPTPLDLETREPPEEPPPPPPDANDVRLKSG